MTSYKFNVEMPCSGCSDTMTRLLSRQKERGVIHDFSVNLESQLVTVKCPLTKDEVLELLEKSGKKVTFLQTFIDEDN